jgi:carbon-monoxide dehydrogenase large subunit
LAEVALTAYVPHNFPHEELEPGLDETAFYDPKNFTYPSGAHIAEIEIDPDTGHLAIVKFTASDDFGRIINPMIFAGQVHGGLAQGIGQALLESCVYDTETGQLLTGSYNDYAMPRADDLPEFHLSTNVTLCTHNPLGVKGCGEAGAIGAPAAITNAIVDALKPLGVKHVEMPATPERLWRVIQQRKPALAAE